MFYRIDAETVEVASIDPVLVDVGHVRADIRRLRGKIVQAAQFSEHDVLGEAVGVDRPVIVEDGREGRRRGVGNVERRRVLIDVGFVFHVVAGGRR